MLRDIFYPTFQKKGDETSDSSTHIQDSKKIPLSSNGTESQSNVSAETSLERKNAEERKKLLETLVKTAIYKKIKDTKKDGIHRVFVGDIGENREHKFNLQQRDLNINDMKKEEGFSYWSARDFCIDGFPKNTEITIIQKMTYRYEVAGVGPKEESHYFVLNVTTDENGIAYLDRVGFVNEKTGDPKNLDHLRELEFEVELFHLEGGVGNMKVDKESNFKEGEVVPVESYAHSHAVNLYKGGKISEKDGSKAVKTAKKLYSSETDSSVKREIEFMEELL